MSPSPPFHPHPTGTIPYLAQGNRVFQYDDAPHHPELSTYPHHTHKGQMPAQGPDEALLLDIPRVDFVTILDKILNEYLGNPETGEL